MKTTYSNKSMWIDGNSYNPPLIKTSCVCGQSHRTYYILTDEVQKDLNNPCPYCGTTLNEDNYNRLQKVEKATSWIQKLRNKLMKLLIKLISFRF